MTDDIRDVAVHCEAKKIAYKQSARDGYIVSFSIHPDDMPQELAAAALGQRYMLVLVAIDDEQQPVVPARRAQRLEPVRVAPDEPPAPDDQDDLQQPQAWRARLAQKAGILCGEKAFQRYLCGRPLSVPCPEAEDAKVAANLLRARLGIESRSQLLDSDSLCRDFERIVREYDLARGLP